jgi:deoxyribodipyrimidine photo-lyase
MTQLPTPEPGSEIDWVTEHLGHLVDGDVTASPVLRGGQTAADAALATLDISGYAARRNEVLPRSRRGATMLSPYIRHGLISLPEAWQAANGAPSRDREKFTDELLWQEYSRHLYARLGGDLARPIRYLPELNNRGVEDPWATDMACVEMAIGELETDGWMVNQTRMWMSSHWSVRHGADWREGEARFFAHLLDGSRAANRTGWQWTIGAGTGKRYGFTRWQVDKRAPGLCRKCPHAQRCPIEQWPDDIRLASVESDPRLRRIEDPSSVAGPSRPVISGEVDTVWLTAESLGDRDPALDAHPETPAVFVFDEALLARLRLSGKRLVFFAECLADLATRRAVTVRLGDPAVELADRRVATTFAPVPGNARLRPHIDIAALYPWPWLRRPSSGPVTSFSAWRDGSGRPAKR